MACDFAIEGTVDMVTSGFDGVILPEGTRVFLWFGSSGVPRAALYSPKLKHPDRPQTSSRSHRGALNEQL